ncbi:galactosylceramide sulfotransferase-like isoform X2 [Amphiura filiformis]
MTSKISMKVVLPLLVVLVVIVSIMQFGPPKFILQTNRFEELPVTRTPTLILVDSTAIAMVDILSNQKSNNESDEIRNTTECQAQNKAVFIKTHKTASSTATSIFERYGYSHNLTFALPWVSHIFNAIEVFDRDMVMTFADMTKFDMLTNHARFNRAEMEAVVPSAKFVTIVREPAGQFESAFGYFRMAKSLGISKKSNPMEFFLENPKKYFSKSFDMKVQSWNGQIFDLGLDHSDCNDTSKVKEYIGKLDKELDLVMLTEYFDESLLLLRQLMCWSYDQIVYLPKTIRNQKYRYKVSRQIAEKIRAWNAADVQLYRHFNATFWRKVDEYGIDFESDIKKFRQLQQNMVRVCFDTNKKGSLDYRTTTFVRKKNAPNICNDLLRIDTEFVSLIRWRQVENEFGLPKLLAGGIILLIVVLTVIIVLVRRLVRTFCSSGNSESQLNCKYTKLDQNSEVS